MLLAGVQVVVGVDTTVRVNQKSFMAYSREVHRLKTDSEASIKHLEQSMTVEQAMELMQKNNQSSTLMSLLEEAMSSKVGKVQEHSSNLRAQKTQPATGYSGVAGAVGMVNEMIQEVNQDHDLETQHCKGEFSTMCSQMEDCRGGIAVANGDAADARACILNQQRIINENEQTLPRTREDLRTTENTCHQQRTELEKTLTVVLADIEVMKAVLKMTACEETTPEKVKAMMMQVSDKHAAFAQLKDFNGIVNASAEFQNPMMKRKLFAALQAYVTEEPMMSGKVTNFENPPLAQEPIPGNPCDGITFDAGGEGGCKIPSSGAKCWKLQDKFLLIQGGIIDEKDRLNDELETLNENCKNSIAVLREQISAAELALGSAQSKLAECTAEENSAAESARLEGEHHHQLETQMFDTRKNCAEKMRALETERCGLGKIRGELEKIQGDTNPAFFKDCIQSEWKEEECSVTCGGGQQRLTRSVVQQPFKGAGCLPAEAYETCNPDPCPVDCEIGTWSGWSACSAECGGGVKQRNREVVVQPEHGGEPCGEKTEGESCGMASCATDCVLSDWAAWTECSKACEGGTTWRERAVTVAATGGGFCAGDDEPARLNTMPCNTGGCLKEMIDEPLPCRATVDVILILDGSSSVTTEGWANTLTFAKTFVSAFEEAGQETNANIALITFSGPYTWDNYYQCTDGASTEMTEDQLTSICGITVQDHFTSDLATLSGKLTESGLPWPTGSTMTQAALATAGAEAQNGRPGVKQIAVLVTDGQPISEYGTYYAAKALKDTGTRLVVVPVQGYGLSDDALVSLQGIASWPTQDNFVTIAGGFEELAGLSTVDKIIADICPQDPCGGLCGKTNIRDGTSPEYCWQKTTEADCNGAYMWMQGDELLKRCSFVDSKCETVNNAEWAVCPTDPALQCTTTTGAR